jgi:hypothetical protein
MAAQTRPKPEPRVPGAGWPAQPLHGCYEVRPGILDEGGEPRPEYWGLGLTQMGWAQGRAGWLSVGGPDQQMLVHREGKEPKLLFEYSHGECTARPECVIPAPPGAKSKAAR